MGMCRWCPRKEGFAICNGDPFGEPSNWKPNRKPTIETNADRIRSMISTDEGLAEALLQDHYGGMFIPFCKNKPECMDLLEEGRIIPQEECKKCMLAWTREPYKENNA